MKRRQFLIAAAATSVLARPIQAQSLAGRTIRLVVPFPPGGPTDIVARPLAQQLGEALGASVFVDNRAGAGGSVGAAVVAKAALDGGTLLMANTGVLAINPSLYKSLPYDPVRDLTPIALVATAPIAIVVHPSVAISDLVGLVALARQSSKKLSYGSAGNGTPGHLTGEMFKKIAGIDLLHVPYKGSSAAITDLLGGQIQVMFDPLQSVLSYIRSGKVRGIAVSSTARPVLLPKLPTIAESGYPGFEVTAWWAVCAPAGLSPTLIAKFASEIEHIAHGDTFRDKLESQGLTATNLTGATMAEFLRNEKLKWGKAVRDSGATVD